MNPVATPPRHSLNVLLVPVGSHGDVHPFVGLGLRLRERGHRVTVLTNPHFAPMIERAGLAFAPLGTLADYAEATSDPDLFNPRKAFFVVARTVMQYVPQMYEHVAAEHAREPGDTVVVGSSLALGARIAEERLGVATVTAHLSPALFMSTYDTPRMAGLNLPRWVPRPVKRALIHGVVDRLMVDRALGPPLNAYRASVGLTEPARGIMRDWWHARRLVINLFPAWFAPPQPDWPAQGRTVGFPLYDERGLEPLPAPLVQFLDAGEPPVAFTPGSAMFHARTWFEAAARACAALGRRGVLLSRHRDHVPATLPPGVIHVDYAPFSELLPRCAALVHHGGIGTSAQALRAGVPQLVTAMAHDQPDNARRLKALGVGDWLWPAAFERGKAVAVLRRLLGDPGVAEACRAVAERFEGVDALGEACALIEGAAPVRAAAKA